MHVKLRHLRMSTQSSTAVLKANYFYLSQYHPDFHTKDCLVETRLHSCGQGVKNPYGKPFVHVCCLGELNRGVHPVLSMRANTQVQGAQS